MITSAETVRKEEYDALTSQMLQLDEDVNAQLEMQVKFKKAYQSMMQKQEEQKVLNEKVEKLQKETSGYQGGTLRLYDAGAYGYCED